MNERNKENTMVQQELYAWHIDNDEEKQKKTHTQRHTSTKYGGNVKCKIYYRCKSINCDRVRDSFA